MIELSDITKRFGSLVAVQHVSLTIPAGEFFALLGPNAAGKSTTLRILCGLLSPDSGHARICGHDVQTHPTLARQDLAFVPDLPYLYDKLTPGEFLRFIGRIFRMPASAMEQSIMEMVGRFHLEPHLDKAIDTLSHGTRQRVALSAALLHAPKVIVIDEPMVGLDPQHARAVKDALRERTKAGATVLLSTHQISVAEEMADRIGIMHEGSLIALGTHQELRERSGQNGPLEAAFLAITQAKP